MDTDLLIVFAVVLLVAWAFKKKTKRRLPPSRFTIPYIGTPTLLAKVRGVHPHELFVEEAKQLGNVFSFSVANKLIVVLNGFDAIHEALVEKADTCSGRLQEMIRYLNSKEKERGVLFSQYGESWREMRRFALQALRDLGVGKMSLEENILTETDALIAFFQQQNGEPLNMNRPLQKLVANVLFGIIFSKRYEYDDPEFDEILQWTNEFASGEGFVNISLFLPEFVACLVEGKNDEIPTKQRLFKKISLYVSRQIDEHESSFDNDNIRDLIDFYWRTVKYGDEKEKKYVTKENMFQVINDLFLAGAETTYVSLEWSVVYMTEFPAIQKKCFDEIDRVVGRRPVTLADKKNLPYTEAVIMEVQRKSNLVPLGVPHTCTDDTVISGFDLPKGTILLPNIYSASNDPKYWEEPERFNPHRFLDASGKLKKNDAFVIFSAGPRTCLGESLAKMELFLVFSNLMQRFMFCPEKEGVRHSLKSVVGHITSIPEKVAVRVVCR